MKILLQLFVFIIPNIFAVRRYIIYSEHAKKIKPTKHHERVPVKRCSKKVKAITPIDVVSKKSPKEKKNKNATDTEEAKVKSSSKNPKKVDDANKDDLNAAKDVKQDVKRVLEKSSSKNSVKGDNNDSKNSGIDLKAPTDLKKDNALEEKKNENVASEVVKKVENGGDKQNEPVVEKK